MTPIRYHDIIEDGRTKNVEEFDHEFEASSEIKKRIGLIYFNLV